MASKYVTTSCSIDGCNNTFKTRTGQEECPACRSSHYYWKKRRPAQILHRRQRLALFNQRLITWYGSDGRKK